MAFWQHSRKQGFFFASEIKPDSSAIDELKAFPFLDTVTTLKGLKQELPLYLAKAVDVSPSIDALTWWRNYSSDRSEATRKVVLIQRQHVKLYSFSYPQLQQKGYFPC